jgi:hypothetical protein
MVPKVRKFNTGVTPPEGQTSASLHNAVPDLSDEAVAHVTATAPVKIHPKKRPRKRRYKQKTYSLLQEDIERIETLVAKIRQAGLYERGRSDIVRAGVHLLDSLPLEEQIKVVNAIENLRS